MTGPKPPVIALVGSESLMGRELRDIAATSSPELALKLIAAEDEEPGALTRVGDMPAVVGGLDADSLAGARAVVLAGGRRIVAQGARLAGPPTKTPRSSISPALPKSGPMRGCARPWWKPKPKRTSKPKTIPPPVST